MLSHGSRVSHVRRRARAPVATLTVGEGPTVLLVHGWTGFKESWGPLMPALAAAGMRAVALDLPGCGATPRGRRGLHTPAGLADALGRVIEDEGAAGVVAHSFGAQVAVLALRQASRTAPMALINPAAVPWPARRVPPRRITDLVRLPLVGAPLTRLALEIARRDPTRREAAYRGAVADAEGLAADPALRALLADAADRLGRVDVGVLVEWLRPALELDLRPLAPDLTAPVLVVTGARDGVVPPWAGAALARAVPRGVLLTVPGAGHFPHLERPARVLPAIVRHLSGRAP